MKSIFGDVPSRMLDAHAREETPQIFTKGEDSTEGDDDDDDDEDEDEDEEDTTDTTLLNDV